MKLQNLKKCLKHLSLKYQEFNQLTEREIAVSYDYFTQVPYCDGQHAEDQLEYVTILNFILAK